MIQLTDKPKEIWAVEVPEGAGVKIQPDSVGAFQIVKITGSNEWIPLPYGTWRYICTSKEIDEGCAEEIVDKSVSLNIWYKDYVNGGSYWKAIESLNSLLVSKGLNVNKNYALIEKQEL